MNDKKTNHYSAVQTSDLESASGHGQVAKGKVDQMARKCRVHIHSKRSKFADTDGISAKGILDGLRKAGIFPDDSTQFIKEITHSQELSKIEETVITVEWEE